ncbi:SMU1112c/YaeR family gloxylase I-like metalloprotein [Gemella morbillorum]|uniref:SMU1112c/YaeR family gloxylase I-like metalloprotein n=1 Tax=Gemella morbillorum TaxID=29391 RepID=UPI00254B2BEA|nr:VOC family protein [Gemella morbillorum]MDK8239690.1 VOC family protein [Gemella morbillorum]MDK8255679.1 VOC family protein [Gemella morbillorum]
MIFESIHHIAIIGRNYNKTKEFYIEKLGFEITSEHHRVDKNDIIINVEKENVVLEIFIKEDAPLRPPIPNPENTGLRHLAFKVKDVEKTLEEFDSLKIVHQGLRYDDFDGKKMAFFFDPDGLPLEIHE